jgi:hypothetical protein
MVAVVVLELLSGFGSLVGLVTVAVFAILEPEKSLGALYVTVIVLVSNGARIPNSQGKAVMQSPVLETKFSPAGVGSSTETLAAFDGPLFVTVIVYVTFVPGMMLAGPVFVISRSATGVSVLLSPLFALLGSDVPTGGVTVAVLTRLPVALAITVPVAVKVIVPPLATLTVALMSPVPEAGQLEPALALQVHVTPVIVAGKLSITFAPFASLGPAFETTIL